MEDKEIKSNIIVFVSLLGLFSIVFFVSQSEHNPGIIEKILYVLSSIILFLYLGSAFMRNTNLMSKITLLFTLISLTTIVFHLYHIWIPFFLKTISLLIVILAFTLALKVYVDKNTDEKRKITIIDQTKKPIRKKGKKK